MLKRALSCGPGAARHESPSCPSASARLPACGPSPAVVRSSRTRTTATSTAAVSRRNLSAGLVGGCLLSVAGLPMLPYGGGGEAKAAMSEIEEVLASPKWPSEFPFRPEDFMRSDDQPDTVFYDRPRFVTHIDDAAINALTKYYGQVFPAAGNQDVAVLDICSSWISHYPAGYKAGRVAGIGMNEQELARNTQLTEFSVRDLNADPKLPYADNSFDVITNCVSVDYLTKPLELFREMHRCLKPGGTAIMSFSNRCFWTKAISIWTQTGDPDHVQIVGSYFHYSVPGGFTDPQAKDISPAKGRSDPMYIVSASKRA